MLLPSGYAAPAHIHPIRKSAEVLSGSLTALVSDKGKVV
jgi:hypothetical protein